MPGSHETESQVSTREVGATAVSKLLRPLVGGETDFLVRNFGLFTPEGRLSAAREGEEEAGVVVSLEVGDDVLEAHFGANCFRLLVPGTGRECFIAESRLELSSSGYDRLNQSLSLEFRYRGDDGASKYIHAGAVRKEGRGIIIAKGSKQEVFDQLR